MTQVSPEQMFVQEYNFIHRGAKVAIFAAFLVVKILFEFAKSLVAY